MICRSDRMNITFNGFVKTHWELCPLRCREDAFFEAGVVLWLFFFIFDVFWVFGSCLICVGLLEYVRTEGWWSQFGESEEDEGVVFLFTVFVSFFSLTLHFAASFCYCIVSDCSSWTHPDGSWACFFFLLRRDLPANDSLKYDTLEICLAAEKVSGTETIRGALEIRGLWRVYPLTRTARNKLLIENLTLRQKSVQVYDKNPFIVRGGSGEEVPVTKYGSRTFRFQLTERT